MTEELEEEEQLTFSARFQRVVQAGGCRCPFKDGSRAQTSCISAERTVAAHFNFENR